MDMVRTVLALTKIDPACLEFEITESVCISSPERTKEILHELKSLGIRISLDDFGTGYSSLSYLRSLPLDVVKIDKSFVDPIGTIPDDKNIVKSIIDMALKLNLQVVAEGIEKLDQFDYLVRNGCDFIQGNYLGRPAPIGAL
jgi:EAL domain-containing protein (putative c-di-GMP-specific phosphodiesterase class I)